MKSSTRRKLIDGVFICPIKAPHEYAYLQTDDNEAKVDAWLREIDMRLARVNESGAYFMACVTMTAADTARTKEDFMRFREIYGPCVRLLDFIRHGKDEFTSQSGDQIQLAELETAVNASSTLESQLRSFTFFIHDAAARNTNRELLKKILEHLAKDGYLVEINANTELYQVTGKIDQLGLVLQVMAEHQPIVTTEDEPVVAVQSRLDAPNATEDPHPQEGTAA